MLSERPGKAGCILDARGGSSGGIAPKSSSDCQGQSSRCTVKCIRSKCDEGCDWCIYVTVVISEGGIAPKSSDCQVRVRGAQ